MGFVWFNKQLCFFPINQLFFVMENLCVLWSEIEFLIVIYLNFKFQKAKYKISSL
jgi:hypothetical protein